jgi:hypothetical protein
MSTCVQYFQRLYHFQQWVWLWNIGASHGLFGCYALRYYCKLEIAYNKYYLKRMTTVSHKPTFVMAKRNLILNTIENRVKEDSMET